MQRVRHDGRVTAYRAVAGDERGQTVLYVHGSGATHRLWSQQYASDGPSHPAVAVDLSGHGESEDIDTDPVGETLGAYADDIVAVARETDADVLVGNSLGGAVVTWIALERALDLSALVLAGTGAKLTVLEALRQDLADDFDAAVATLHGEDMLFHDATERIEERSKETMRTVGQAVTRRDFETCHRFDVRDRLDEIDVPTLAVCGDHDRLTPPAYHEYLAEGIPDATVETIPRAAHLAMVELPAEFNDAVAAFLAAQ